MKSSPPVSKAGTELLQLVCAKNLQAPKLLSWLRTNGAFRHATEARLQCLRIALYWSAESSGLRDSGEKTPRIMAEVHNRCFTGNKKLC